MPRSWQNHCDGFRCQDLLSASGGVFSKINFGSERPKKYNGQRQRKKEAEMAIPDGPDQAASKK